MKKIKIIMLIIFALAVKTEAMDLIWQTQPHSDQINGIIYSADLNKFITIGNDKSLKLIDVHTGKILDSTIFELNPKHISYSQDKSELLITFKSRNHGAVKICDADNFELIKEVSFSPLFETNVPYNNQEFIECHAIDLGNNKILAGSGIYKYVNANHSYKGHLTIFDRETGDTLNSVYTGGMITNLKISPNKEYIAFTTLFRSSEYQSPKVYKETEKTELILTDKNFTKIQILRNDFKEDYQYVDSEIFNAINFSPDSKKLVTVTDEHHIFVYSTESGEMTDSIYSCDCYGDMDVGFLYNNKNVVSGTNNGKVYIWNLDYDINVDSYRIDDTPYLTAIACSEQYNLYAIGDYKGRLFLLTSREFSGVKNENNDLLSITQNGKFINIVNNTNEKIKIEIYNILANKLYESNTTNFEYLINTECLKLQSGIYFLTIRTNIGYFFGKVIIY